ncbi:putative late blight resistance protein homolog R1A-10 [Salvia miltiorrhiza]|uniref:putative late blight resistance protein homolog R1A-10 n=1 Tax=Salvia miltiorrhiza TaxID=226208 RepID=UPI0025AD4786|nr:putative late blight resistance protein homolog R1A-10 [Salvia miltiorrhiza]
MAYAAVNSLLYTIDHLLNSNRISFVASTSETLDFALDRVKSLQGSLRQFDDLRNNTGGVMASEARIRDEARRLEDAIESHVSAQFLSQSQNHDRCPPTLSLTLQDSRQAIDCFAKTADKMENEYIEELHKPLTEEEEEDAAGVASLGNDSGGNECEMVGLSDFFLKIRNLLIANANLRRTAICIGGMAGVGKTMLALKLFHDPLIKANFECRAFVRVGRKYRLEEILRAIIAQVDLVRDEMITEAAEDLYEYSKRILSGRKYYIVLDDTWDLGFYLDLKSALPNEDNGSRILLTSRKTRTIEPDVTNAYSFTMPFLDEEESWDLLKKKVFGEEEFPRRLMKAGKKIAKNCEGLPLLILVVAARLLSEDKNDMEYWNEVAEKKNSVFEDSCDQISEVLLLSYRYMRQYLKLCFLYIGVFPQNYVVRRSRIITLWGGEGILEHSGSHAIDKFASHNLVLVCGRCLVRGARVHAFRLHPAYWYMCRKEAESSKLFCFLSSYADCSVERVTNQRCFAIYNNVLFAIKEVHDSLASISTARSVLCTGPYHQYQVPICLDWKLLRVLDALTIRFYEFPDEVVKLIQLTYLGLTCDANLPPSISRLWKLSYLIVHRHLSIKWTVDESYLPVEIWDLQELKHLEIIGRNLPNPTHGAVLPNLRKLLDVGAHSCGKEVLESIPNLRKLRLQIELAPDSTQALSLFDHVSCLEELKSIQCVIVNPEVLCEPIVPPPALAMSVESLKKLSLSGSGYPWQDMSKICELPYLAVLKLRNYAFQGEKWEAKERGFPNLKYLLIEDTDIVQWTAGDGSFPRLRCLTMKNCYNVEEIPLFASDVEVLLSPHIIIELVDCNPLAETCAKQRYGAERVNVNYSWK